MRSISVDQQAAIDAASYRMVWFIEFAWDPVTRVTTASHDMDWNGYTWKGMGRMATIEPIGESSGLAAEGWRATLAAQPTSLLSLALQEHVQGTTATVYVAWLDENQQPIDVPPTETIGIIDTTPISVSGGQFTISVNVESELSRWNRASGKRFTDASHQQDYPGDDYFRYVDQMAEKALVWPNAEFFR